MENLTPDQLMDTVVVLLAVFAAIVTVDKVIDIVKKWRTPSADVKKKLTTDKTRLDAHEKSIQNLQESNQVLCSGIMALLEHELHNGNGEQMQKAHDDIMHYLQENIGRQ